MLHLNNIWGSARISSSALDDGALGQKGEPSSKVAKSQAISECSVLDHQRKSGALRCISFKLALSPGKWTSRKGFKDSKDLQLVAATGGFHEVLRTTWRAEVQSVLRMLSTQSNLMLYQVPFRGTCTLCL